MRDAFGGSFMIKVILVFIFIYVGFIAIALNYAKGFRLKNTIMDYMEDNQILLDDKKSVVEGTKFDNDILAITNKFDYHTNFDCSSFSIDKTVGSCHSSNGVVFVKRSANKSGVNYIYYDVYVAISYDFGFIKLLKQLTSDPNDNSDMSGYWTISGQTKVIVGESNA